MRNTIAKLLFVIPMVLSALLVSLYAHGQAAERNIENVAIYVGGMMKSRSGATWLDWPDGVSAALVELAGIHDVEVFLDRDAFTLNYEPDLVSLEQITQTITDLGYQPEVLPGGLQPLDPTPAVSGPIPEPLASTLPMAQAANKFVFIDFYAAWCGPCIVMEETTLSDPEVKQTLESFIFLKVDTDDYPELGTHYGIIGIPTLIVVEGDGTEIWRQVGSITAAELVSQLNNL